MQIFCLQTQLIEAAKNASQELIILQNEIKNLPALVVTLQTLSKRHIPCKCSYHTPRNL